MFTCEKGFIVYVWQITLEQVGGVARDAIP